MVRRNCFVAAIICCTLLPSGAGRAAFTASPMELHLRIEAGGVGVPGVSITNKGDRPITLKLYLNDNRLLLYGTEENLPPGTIPRSCAPWITLNDEILELGPKETWRTSLRLEVPPGAEGSYWTKLLIEEISKPQPTRTVVDERTYEVFLMQRVGIRVFEDVPGTEVVGARITNVGVHQDDDDSSRVLVSVENTGNTLLRCTGTVELRESGGTVVEILPLGPGGTFSIFPDSHRKLVAPFEAEFPLGTYVALAIVDFGADHLVAGDTVFRVTADGVVPGPGASRPPQPAAQERNDPTQHQENLQDDR